MKTILKFLIIIIFASCNESPKGKSFKLNGQLNGGYSDYIYLSYGNVKDSVKVAKGRFEFNGVVERPVQGWLNLKPDSNIAWIYIENSNISIKADYTKKVKNEKIINFLKINNVKGSYSAKIQNEYKDFYQSNKNKENFKDLLYNKLNTYIEKNKNHPLSGKILGEIAFVKPVLTKNELIELYSKLDTTQQNKDDLKCLKWGLKT